MSTQDSENTPQDQPLPEELSSAEAQSNEPERTQPRGGESPTAKFRQQVASKQSDFDDYDPEENLWSGRYSSKAMVGTWIVMFVASIALVVLAIVIEPFPWSVAAILILVMWVLGVSLYLWRRLGYHYQLTTQRFIHKTGIITQRTDRIEVIDLDDVSFTQGPVQRMFGVGTIRLTGSDRSHPELSMLGIAKVDEVAGLIDDIRRKERRRRSLHIESI
ncbi:Bacterial membrane flanked domain protein [Novipirellula aureliae]|uniref:Bacterial membrane flanked domain protein n=1 Tax=Novipirellula aureliae TaxID=2527966 RepID=A0A5C6E5F3_9BACT|nr:PH domain-containing protein [Novipirellula aureliae]TWU43744.1 Bacterial membrane flanked domain protein [Novipirellula aureliae]